MRGRVLRLCVHNAGAAEKKRGDNHAGYFESILTAGPPSQGAVSGTGQALQGGTIPQDTEGVVGDW